MSFQCELQEEPDESTEITWLKVGKYIPESERVSDFFDILKKRTSLMLFQCEL